jgi:hypothetical protein
MDDPELINQLRLEDERTLSQRARRLSFLARFRQEGQRAFPHHAYQYIEDARMCWLARADFAVVVMAQLAAEELLRAAFRTAGVCPFDEKAGFADLIAASLRDGLIAEDERRSLDKLRRMRNDLVHVKYPTPDATAARTEHWVVAQDPRAMEAAAQEALTTLFTFILARPPYYWIAPGPLS